MGEVTGSWTAPCPDALRLGLQRWGTKLCYASVLFVIISSTLVRSNVFCCECQPFSAGIEEQRKEFLSTVRPEN